ncbi:MAG: PIN domain-containing protein [Candidatus Eremiobacterota bacterium]
MSKPVVLDSGPLGKLAHPRVNKDIKLWFETLLKNGAIVIIPEIADYEVRRSLLHENLLKSIERLNELKKILLYLPINTDAILKAAELWAEARKIGKPTGDPHALDGDVILAAQALQVNGLVATENVGHLSLFIEAKPWNEIF